MSQSNSKQNLYQKVFAMNVLRWNNEICAQHTHIQIDINAWR